MSTYANDQSLFSFSWGVDTAVAIATADAPSPAKQKSHFKFVVFMKDATIESKIFELSLIKDRWCRKPSTKGNWKFLLDCQGTQTRPSGDFVLNEPHFERINMSVCTQHVYWILERGSLTFSSWYC